MKAKRERVNDKLIVIKLFASNYARDLVYVGIYASATRFQNMIKERDDN
jgi:hypothetical protein